MTELFEIATGTARLDEVLVPKVTKAIGGKLIGKFIVGLFYQRNNLLYCYSAPDNERENNWSNTPVEAVKRWEIGNPGDNRKVINPYLL